MPNLYIENAQTLYRECPISNRECPNSLRGLPHGELAAAVLLVVEAILLEQLVATVLQSALAPVLIPERGAGNGLLRRLPCPVDLLQALPSAGGQGGSEVTDSQLRGFTCRGQQSHAEALLTTESSFGLVLQPANALQPRVVVVVAVNPADTQRFGMALALVLTDVVLLSRPDVWIVIEDSGAHVMQQQPLHNGR